MIDPTDVARLHGEGLGIRAIASALGATEYAVRRSITAQGLPPHASGRPDEGRVHAVIVRLTADELERVDRERCGVSRAEWVRTRALVEDR